MTRNHFRGQTEADVSLRLVIVRELYTQPRCRFFLWQESGIKQIPQTSFDCPPSQHPSSRQPTSCLGTVGWGVGKMPVAVVLGKYGHVRGPLIYCIPDSSLDLLLRDPLPMSQHSCYEQRTLEAWDERALYHLL